MNVRTKIAGELEAKADQVVSGLVDIALNATKKAWAYCPNCRKKVQADFPDLNARVKATEMLFEQGYGRPGTSSAVGALAVDPADLTLEALDKLSMRELALLGGFEIVDGAIVDLPPRDARPTDLEDWIERVRNLSVDLPDGFIEKLLELDELVREHERMELRSSVDRVP